MPKFRKQYKRKAMEINDKEPEPAVVKEKVDQMNDVHCAIQRPPNDPSTLLIYIRSPTVARIVRSMTPSNYPKDKFAAIYQPILKELEQNKAHAVTRAAIAKATKNFVPGVDFSFAENPRSILLANPDALEAGYTLTYKVETPVAMEQIKKWVKLFMTGCDELIVNARPFKMSWIMDNDSEVEAKDAAF